MRFLILIVLLLGLAAAMVITNPDRNDVDAEVEAQLLSSIDALDTSANQDPTVKLIFNTCKLSRNACVKVMKSLVSVTVDDKIVYSNITVQFGNEAPIQCYDALTRVICPDL